MLAGVSGISTLPGPSTLGLGLGFATSNQHEMDSLGANGPEGYDFGSSTGFNVAGTPGLWQGEQFPSTNGEGQQYAQAFMQNFQGSSAV